MTEQEYEKLVLDEAHKDSEKTAEAAWDTLPVDVVCFNGFVTGNKWTRENPPPEVQALVDVTRQLAECRPDKQQCEMFTLRTAARGAIARFKERSKG